MTREQLDRLFDQAAKHFNSSGKALNEDVRRLEEWLEMQTHLPKMLDAHALRNFLILNKGSVEVTKQRIDGYYSVRARVPEIAYEMNPKRPHMKEFDKIAYVVDHPQLTDDMCKLTFFKIKGEFISPNLDPINYIRKMAALTELKLRHDVMHGDIFVFDYKGLTLNAALKVTPMLLYKVFVVLHDGVLSTRFKAAHIINMAPPITKMMQAVKIVMKPKLFERVHIHSDEDALKKVIPLNLLPSDWGGKGLSLQELEEILDAKLAQNQELFDRLDEIKVDEDLRPKKLIDDCNLGVHGNFKKIEID
ncbi:retinaldehyde-binding protein 1-like [Zophobas morio]|uniref:retinaldehyde-binding protein 1-like n=1 Tax=Zophobas morio TaxID=2755281 RepID=UPI00308382EE